MMHHPILYEIMVEDTFSAAHQLRDYGGKCENLHGHNWKVQVFLASPQLNELGFVVDFSDLKKKLGEILALFDHEYLNNLAMFQDKNPTAENIAAYILTSMQVFFDYATMYISKVCVFESEKACATAVAGHDR